MKRPIYDVLIQTHDSSGEPGDIVQRRVTIIHGDRLRGEHEAHKAGLPPVNKIDHFAQNFTTVYIWCALVRLGLYSENYQTFKNRDLLEVAAAVDEHGKPLQESVDPTRPDTPSGTPSSSPASSAEAPATGSTPTSMTS